MRLAQPRKTRQNTMADLDSNSNGEAATVDDRFASVPVDIAIHIGTARLSISKLLSLEEDVVLPLDRAIEEPVDLYVGDRLIARGELEEVGSEGSGRLGVRVTEVVSPGAAGS